MREANNITLAASDEVLFDVPVSTGGWWAGGYVEHYVDARVILPAPESGREYSEGALIVSTTERGFQVLSQVAENLGFSHTSTTTVEIPDTEDDINYTELGHEDGGWSENLP
jgi:hypothetical protein